MIKSESGITTTSLVVYVVMFSIIAGIIALISNFFYENIFTLYQNTGKSQEYNMFNLYMLKHTKDGYELADENIENTSKLKLSNGENEITFTLVEGILYYNQIKLCENIDDFSWNKVETENGKEMIETYLTINGKVYKTDYVVNGKIGGEIK